MSLAVRVTLGIAARPNASDVSLDFVVDPTRARRTVRAKDAGDVGHMSWLKLTEESKSVRRISSACDTARVSIGDFSFTKRLDVPLASIRDAMEVSQRQFGSLGELGAAVQLRFGAAISNERGEWTCEVIDGALTIDPLHPNVCDAAEAIESAVMDEAAEAMGKVRVASIGKNPVVWTPRLLEKGDEGYAEGEKRYELDWRGRERVMNSIARIQGDLDSYKGLGSEAIPLMGKLADRRLHWLALQARLTAIHEMAALLRKGSLGANTNARGGVVAAEVIDALHENLSIKCDQNGETVSVRECGVYFDDLEGCDAANLDAKAEETVDEIKTAAELSESIGKQLEERMLWESFESGVETRDMLENGVRRADMERLLGRPATKRDVEDSMCIPDKLRAKLIAGYDVEKSRERGRYIGASSVSPARLL
jgi:hypothetical protein